MELAIYFDTELLPFQKVNNRNRWQFPLLKAFDDKLLPFMSHKRMSPKGSQAKSFTLHKVEINNDAEVVILSSMALLTSELKRKIKKTRDVYYYLANLKILGLTPGLYQFRFEIEAAVLAFPDKGYQSNIFCYDPEGNLPDGDFVVGDFLPDDFNIENP